MTTPHRLVLILAVATAACAGAAATANKSTAPSGGSALATLPPVRAGCPRLAVLDSAGLMHDVFTIAADSMDGRAPGSRGAAKTRDFFASKFDAIGLGVLAPGRIHVVPTSANLQARGVKTGANIVGVVKGSAFPDQYIVVTAHWDHLGIRPQPNGADSIYNGADDNGSGAAALITLAKYYAKAKPKHSIVLAEVDGEESGMWGSKYFVDTPTVPLDKIMIEVNLDMLGRNIKGELYATGTHKYPKLQPMVEAVAECSPLTLKLGHDGEGNSRDDWATQSDQGVFHRKGIQFIYFGEEDHPDYHKPSDHADRLQPAFYIGALRTVVDFLNRFDAEPVAR